MHNVKAMLEDLAQNDGAQWLDSWIPLRWLRVDDKGRRSPIKFRCCSGHVVAVAETYLTNFGMERRCTFCNTFVFVTFPEDFDDPRASARVFVPRYTKDNCFSDGVRSRSIATIVPRS